jgi:Chalcone isomerase like
MSSLNPTTRLFSNLPTVPKLLGRSKCFYLYSQTFPSSARHLATKRTASGTPSNAPLKNPIDPIALHRLEAERRAYYRRRSYYAGAGFVAGMIAIWIIATSIDLPPKPTQLDAPIIDKRKDDSLVAIGRERKVVAQKLAEEPEESVDVVETGASTVPTFPRILDRPAGRDVGTVATDDGVVEYQLLGLGIRTVSFLRVQVYVVGMYVATDDIARLQEVLMRRIDPIAMTLVAGEREKLRNILMDSELGEDIWNQVLKDTAVRTLLRIVPTRDTDFGHMRDGWVRAIEARARKNPEEFGDEGLRASVNDFKTLFRKGRVPKKKELLLARNGKGVMTAWYDDGKNGVQRLGDVQEEKISRAIWLNYLAGKTVASETARKNIIEGVMELVERPVGTVATQVHA